MSCSKKSCRTHYARKILSIIAGFIFVSIYGMVVHGNLLTSLYMQSQNLWRTVEEMQQLAPLSMMSQFICVALVSLLICLYKNKSCAVFLGVVLGCINGVHMASSYVYMPIPSHLAVAWFFTGFFETVILVVLMSFIMWGKECKIGLCCKKQNCGDGACGTGEETKPQGGCCGGGDHSH